MSQENVRRFYEAIARDESLKAEVTAIATRHGNQNLDESQLDAIWENEILPLAKGKGFDLTLEEVRAFSTTQAPRTGKLADEELDAVVGGGECYCILGGGGTAGEGADVCACVVLGWGYYEGQRMRCTCSLYGSGAA